jgi:excisionase family DNA binding protein
MATFFTDISPDVIELARAIEKLIYSTVKRAVAERASSTEGRPSEWLYRDEAAKILGVKPRTIYAYIEQGKLTRHSTGPKGGSLSSSALRWRGSLGAKRGNGETAAAVHSPR